MVIAAEELAKRGYYVLPMENLDEEPLVSGNPRRIEYALTPLRSDFADMFHQIQCAAYLGSNSGISVAPLIYRSPVGYVNYELGLVNQLTIVSQTPFIIQHLWHRETRCFLGLREVYELGLMDSSESRMYELAGVGVVSNTQEEICDLAVKLDE